MTSTSSPPKTRRISSPPANEFGALDNLVARRRTAPTGDSNPTALPAAGQARPEILLIDLDLLHANPNQPRTAFRAAGIDELAQSIYRFGLLSALTVTPDRMSPMGQTYRVVAGERRLRAVKKLVDTDGHDQFRRVPCIVTYANQGDQMLAALTENLQREDLSPLEEAEFTKVLKQESGKSTAELASSLALTESWVVQRLQIADALTPETRDILIEWQRAAIGDAYAPAELKVHGKPSFTFLRRLASAPKEVQAEAAREVRARGFSAREADAYVREVTVASNGTSLRRRGRRLARQFRITPSDELELSTQERAIPVHTASGTEMMSLKVADIRGLNVVQLLRHAERRGWLVDLQEYLQDLRDAVAADEVCIAALTQEADPEHASGARARVSNLRA